MKGSVWIRVMLWNQCLHITVLNVKLLTMRNYKRERHGDLDTFWGEEGLHNCVWFQLDWTWRKHHCQITSDSLNNFYCVPFHELFTAYISDYYSLLLPAWKFVQPPCAEGVVSAPYQSIWSQNLPSGVLSNVISHSQIFLDSAGILLILMKMTLCQLWDYHSM